jgi:hypothetical protein
MAEGLDQRAEDKDRSAAVVAEQFRASASSARVCAGSTRATARDPELEPRIADDAHTLDQRLEVLVAFR